MVLVCLFFSVITQQYSSIKSVLQFLSWTPGCAAAARPLLWIYTEFKTGQTPCKTDSILIEKSVSSNIQLMLLMPSVLEADELGGRWRFWG